MIVSICPKCSGRLESADRASCPSCGWPIGSVEQAGRNVRGGSEIDAARIQETLLVQAECPSLSRLREYLAERLSAADEQTIEQHVEGCPACEQILRDLTDNRVRCELEQPATIGRYQVRETIGQGNFGTVYLARDEQLRRDVAIKVPHHRILQGDLESAAALNEGRMLATLDHPHIVPVYDVGQIEPGRYYIVSKYIAGRNLAEEQASRRWTWRESAELVATIAAALHTAHQRKLIHRDIKPANILIDASGKPFVADFGLALSAATFGHRPWQGGTPAYLSPEQSRGEGHLVDGRSDIFSLGVVLYELLTGERPFTAPHLEETLERTRTLEVRPPRQLVDTLPKELERICLRCLEKRPGDRYTTAKDLATDLRDFLASHSEIPVPAGRADVRIVPRGLRAFGTDDADFFPQLLPGPVDRDGIPIQIQFWKSRIEETQPDATFRVGLLYGPSGCGKSSLVKAGLIPRLAGHVLPVYVDASGPSTTERLERQLRIACPWLDTEGDLTEILQLLRREPFATDRGKLLVVIDQLEQLFHFGGIERLVPPLRQCDGARVQCLMLVRDEYWMESTRLLRQLDVELQSTNSAAVDLFDSQHARGVLMKFGQAYGRLPNDGNDLSRDQRRFIDRAVSEFSEPDGRVIPVRLALFAEMVKGKPWTEETLRAVGGTEGLGIAFLDEAFRGRSAPLQHRLRLSTARSVLRALLPPEGDAVRGEPQPHAALLFLSGCRDRPEFDELMRILDQDLRLVTPTGWDGNLEVSSCDRTPPGADATTYSSGQYYQLTHDYLVPALRQWLHRDDLRTFRGRAQLVLQERTARWSGKPERRQLPTLLETIKILAGTRRRLWTAAQRRMMARAVFRHASFLAVAMFVLLAAAAGMLHLRANHLITSLVDARQEAVPAIIDKLDRADPVTRHTVIHRIHGFDPQSRESVWLGILLSGWYGPLEQPLVRGIPRTNSRDFAVIRQLFQNRLRPEAVELLQAELRRVSNAADGSQLRVASILVQAPGDPLRLTPEVAQAIADQLVAVSASELSQWLGYLQPIHAQLEPAFLSIYRDTGRPMDRKNAARILLEISSESAEVVSELLVYEDDNSFREWMDKVLPHGAKAGAALEVFIDRLTSKSARQAAAADEDEQARCQRVVRAAVGLCRLGRPSRVWPLLKRTESPDIRARFIHRLRPWNVDPRLLCEYLLAGEVQPDVRNMVILALGEFDADAIPHATRERLASLLVDWYSTDVDPGVHSAARWLLELWGHAERLNSIDREFATMTPRQTGWFVSPEEHTMVVLSPAASPGRTSEQTPGGTRTEADSTQSIEHRFAISTTEVTVGQFVRFLAATWSNRGPDIARPSSGSRLPQQMVTWHMAARYCNWLSSRAGLDESEWCYSVVETGEGMAAVDDVLQRPGYRLPTDAEWDFACRSGTTTTRFHGSTTELLPYYAWFRKNSDRVAHEVARLKPNDFGLFDMYGNVLEWCHNRPSRSGSNNWFEDDGLLRLQRGGHYVNPAPLIRGALPYSDPPEAVNPLYGFRVAKTIGEEP